MASALSKETLRSITGSLGRFVAIAGIVALGCGFYAGLRMTAPDMDLAADAYYDETDLMDVRVVSTLGLDDADLEAMGAVPGVAEVEGAYETDVLATLNGEQYAMRVHSLPYDAPLEEAQAAEAMEAEGTLNKLQLTEGRWPTAAGECLISADNVMASPVALGDRVAIDEGAQGLDGVLDVRECTVVGLAHSPYYVSTTAMGATSLGSGTIDQFMYVPASDFAGSLPYTEAFVTVEGAAGLLSGSEAYQARVDEVTAALEAIAPERERARLTAVKAEAQEELDAKRAEFEAQRADAEAQLGDARSKLDAAAATLATSEGDLARGQAELTSGVTELEGQRRAAEEGFAAAEAELATRQRQLDGVRAQADQVSQALADPSLPADERARLEAQLAQLQGAAAGLEQGIAAGRQQLGTQRAAAEERFADAERQLAAARSQLASGRAQLASGRAEYQSGLADYDASRAEADERFADAERQLADAQADIDAIELPEWMVMDRTKNPGAVSFESDADRVDSIAAFFPFIFFLVAALVALTTMTRMVEEERVLIGTFKALGYSRARITSKYLAYAAAASVVGSVVGIVALSLLLPPVIMEAYAIIYSVPHAPVMPIDPAIALSSAALGVGVTVLATWFAVASTLREAPAQLMLPRAPKEGKRILLERVGPLWRRLSFSWKVTFRNIFRYKKRLVMTVIGIAGCTGMLLTGLGLQDAVNDIIDKQFGQTVLYNVQVASDDGFAGEAREQLEGLTEERAFAQVESMMASGPDKADVSVSVVVPEDGAAFQRLWVMRTRVGHEPIALGPDAVVVTEKLATVLGVGVGDGLTLAEQDAMGNATSATYELPVTGIMENYVANYVFLGQQAYEGAFGQAPRADVMFAKVPDGAEAHQAFRDAASQVEGVETVAFNNETIDAYRQMLRSVNMIVVVLVVAAAALAFIVLYNLTNINITERVREIATLKVLGFTPHEVDMYIYRETILLTVLGALVGLGFGVVLEGFVIVTAEVDYVMFGRDIHLLSFVVAFVVTVAFAVVVMLAMRRKLACIDMVESLKSNE